MAEIQYLLPSSTISVCRVVELQWYDSGFELREGSTGMKQKSIGLQKHNRWLIYFSIYSVLFPAEVVLHLCAAGRAVIPCEKTHLFFECFPTFVPSLSW